MTNLETFTQEQFNWLAEKQGLAMRQMQGLYSARRRTDYYLTGILQLLCSHAFENSWRKLKYTQIKQITEKTDSPQWKISTTS